MYAAANHVPNRCVPEVTIYRLVVPVSPQLQSIKPEDVIDDGPIQRLEKSRFLGVVSKISKRDQK